MTMSRKAPPHKKKHTKPCKFFQVNRCPHPADVCNFAHVIASPSDRGSSMYRYYPDYYAQDTPSLRRYSYGPRDIPLTPLSISQKATADDQLSPSPDSNTTGSTSMSTLDLDEAVIVTDDPQYHEHVHSYQSQVFVEDDSPVIHVPPYSPYHQLTFNGPHMSPYSYDDSGKPLYAFKPRSSTRSSTKLKNLKYKTKPCRFFPTERGCPKGTLCTFIHDEMKHQIPSPVKESIDKEENSRKNYFPVSWRVIGGGVRVGITETEDSDMYSTGNTSHPVNHSAPSKLEMDTPIKMVSRQRSNSNPPAPSPHALQFKVEHLFSAESPGVL